MADELDTELNQPSESEKRIRQLSGKVKEEAELRAAADTARAAAEAKAAEADKKAAFAEGFADVLSANPAAKDHRADIQAKVMAGQSVQDAMYAVLGPLGKIAAATVPVPEVQSPAGGSASFAPPQGGAQDPQKMTQIERLAALKEAEARGDLST